MEYQMTFKRYELKYLLTKKQKERILQAMEPYMIQDQFGRSTIRNIYYDTDNYRLIRNSIEKPVYKEKLRVRSYRQAAPEDSVFVELKKKYCSVVYKRRISMTQQETGLYLNEGREPVVQTQITREIDYFRQYYQTLGPKVFISYDREAYYARDDSGFRVTLDENILWRNTDLSLGKGVYGNALLSGGSTLMEVKTAGGMPIWMVRLLSEEKLFKTTFSKYGNAYQDMAFSGSKGEIHYA